MRIETLNEVRIGKGLRPVRSRDRGSVLPLGIALLFLGALLSLRQYSLGELYSAKQRITTAADASAYSAALWQARVLNFHAYANRAILANEVAIAQAVTLVAWADYIDQLVQNAETVGSVVPGAAPLLQTAAQGAAMMREGMHLGAAAEIAARGGWQHALRMSQDLLASSVTHFALNSVANEVARANDSRFFAWVLPGAEVTIKTAHVDAPGRQRFAALVTASLDPFTAGPRERDLRLPLPSGCLLSSDPDKRTPWFRKRGGTALTSGLERWEAVDTLSLHVPMRRGLLVGPCEDLETPLGWGSAQADALLTLTPKGLATGAKVTSASSGQTGGAGQILNPQPGLRANPRANALAAADQATLMGYTGLIAIRDLENQAFSSPGASAGGSAGDAGAGPIAAPITGPFARLTVLARSEAANLRTANRIGFGSGRLAMAEPVAGGRLWALGSAEVYFHRPAAAPERTEYASLWNPYWQVRMVPTPPAQQLAALALAQGVGSVAGAGAGQP